MAGPRPVPGPVTRPVPPVGRLGADVLRALIELARARRDLGRASGRELVRLARRRQPRHPLPEGDARAIVDRVAFVLPRVAARVPWRADCLVQALAAQSWLARCGVPSELFIGVRSGGAGFEAHAWLRSGGQAVTGGDASGYVPIIDPKTPGI